MRRLYHKPIVVRGVNHKEIDSLLKNRDLYNNEFSTIPNNKIDLK